MYVCVREGQKGERERGKNSRAQIQTHTGPSGAV